MEKKKMLKAAALLFIVLLPASIAMVSANNANDHEGGYSADKQNESDVQEIQYIAVDGPDLYVQVNGIEDQYTMLKGYKYFQIPINVEVWDKDLNPQNDAEVYINIAKYDPVIKGWITEYDTTKNTTSSGKVKFGFFIPMNNISTYHSVVITAGHDGEYTTYMKQFKVVEWNNSPSY